MSEQAIHVYNEIQLLWDFRQLHELVKEGSSWDHNQHCMAEEANERQELTFGAGLPGEPCLHVVLRL